MSAPPSIALALMAWRRAWRLCWGDDYAMHALDNWLVPRERAARSLVSRTYYEILDALSAGRTRR